MYGGSATTVYLKIMKSGTTYTLYNSNDNGLSWVQIKQYTNIDFGSSIKVGLLAQSNAGVNADFDWFDLKAIHTDDFESSTIAGSWSWVRADNNNWSLTERPGSMKLKLQGGDLYQTTNSTNNILLRDTPAGDWSIITKLEINPNQNYQQAGLIVYKDDDNYIKLTRAYADGSNCYNYAKEIGGGYSDFGCVSESATKVYMKITKSGTTYTLYNSNDSGSTWVQLKQYTGISFTSPFKVGLFAQSNAGVNADFAWFDLQ